MTTSKSAKSRTAASRTPPIPCTDAHLPSATLSRFAAAAGVSSSALTTITVHEEAGGLFSALLEYTGMYVMTVSSKTPLLVTSLRSPVPSDGDTESDDSDSSYRSESYYSDQPPPGRKNLGVFHQSKGERPIYKLGYGETAVVWPPPEEISAKTLWEKHRREREHVLVEDGKKLLEKEKATDDEQSADNVARVQSGDKKENAASTSATSGEAGGDEPGKTVQPKKEAADKSQSANKETPASATDANEGGAAIIASIEETEGVEEVAEEPLTFYIAHKTLGEPQGISDTVETYDEVFVATTASHAELNSFLEGVLSWEASRFYYRPRRHVSHSYHLYRFKLNSDGDGYWHDDGRKPSRPPSSVILPEGQMEAILDDISTFLSSDTEAWYSSHGLPARRAYLFFGPPGTGKTSTIRAISSEFGRNCCFLSMANSKFSNQALCDALSSMPDDALIVLEDVDALFTKRKSNNHSLTFSGLLNALDGVMSADGVITIMTTNYIDRLDDAILRGGRVDRRFYFGPPTNEQIKNLFKSFYPDAENSVTESFLEKIAARPAKDNARSAATLQQLFIYRRQVSAEECVEGVDEFFEIFFPIVEDLPNGDAPDSSEEEEGKEGGDDKDGTDDEDGDGDSKSTRKTGKDGDANVEGDEEEDDC